VPSVTTPDPAPDQPEARTVPVGEVAGLLLVVLGILGAATCLTLLFGPAAAGLAVSAASLIAGWHLLFGEV
jgi:hypothetical protein